MFTMTERPTGFVAYNMLPEDGESGLYWPLSLANNVDLIYTQPRHIVDFSMSGSSWPTSAAPFIYGTTKIWMPQSSAVFAVAAGGGFGINPFSAKVYLNGTIIAGLYYLVNAYSEYGELIEELPDTQAFGVVPTGRFLITAPGYQELSFMAYQTCYAEPKQARSTLLSIYGCFGNWPSGASVSGGNVVLV